MVCALGNPKNSERLPGGVEVRLLYKKQAVSALNRTPSPLDTACRPQQNPHAPLPR